MQTLSRSTFDVASQPGLRAELADIYTPFRTRQAASQAILYESQTVQLNSRTMCPGCGAAVGIATPLFTKNGITHQACTACRLVYTAQTLAESADAALYDDTPFMQAYAEIKRHPLYARLEHTKATYLLQQMQQQRPALHTVLDIGASTGGMMAAASDLGLKAYGVEPDRALARHLLDRHGQRCVIGYFPQDIPSVWPRFDLITLLDVLEHMVEPVAFLRQVARHLAPGGALLVQVPNYHSLLVQLEGVTNSNFCVGHWLHFSPYTLPHVLARAGFDCLSTGTCISEFDRVQQFTEAQILAAMQPLVAPARAELPRCPNDLYALGLGYKLFGLFSPVI
jgi:2-polyprenyl-3-methyl-5-hydroxy-6-metoxy-1,4-benzoquinol methylase